MATDLNSINPNLYHLYSNSPKDLYQYTVAQREEVHYNALLKEERPNKFKAIVLSGYRTQMNTGVGTDSSDAAFVPASDGQLYMELTVYPISSWYGLQIPNPIQSKNKGKLKSIIQICTELCRVRSKFPADGNQTPLSFGQVIDIERENNAMSLSYEGMRFTYPEGIPQRVPEFDQLHGIQPNQSAIDLFAGGMMSMLMGNYLPVTPAVPVPPLNTYHPTNPDQYPGSILPIDMSVARVTSRMGYRPDPFGRNKPKSKHGGIDIGAALGTPMYAIFDGVVTHARGTTIGGKPVGGFGAWVVVKHSKIPRNDGQKHNLYALYGHVAGSYVKVGDKVTQGQTITIVGNEGGSTGPHLHFELCTNFYKRGETKLEPIYSLGWGI